MSPSTGYSGTPLAKKLGIKAGHRVCVVDGPAGFRALLDPLPDAVRFQKRADASTDVAHVFVTDDGDLARHLRVLRETLGPAASLWISWPKKASKAPTTVTEDVVRRLALPLGFVDVKVCAVDEIWSGLKLVVRKELR
jgi:hypothetical protein